MVHFPTLRQSEPLQQEYVEARPTDNGLRDKGFTAVRTLSKLTVETFRLTVSLRHRRPGWGGGGGFLKGGGGTATNLTVYAIITPC